MDKIIFGERGGYHILGGLTVMQIASNYRDYKAEDSRVSIEV